MVVSNNGALMVTVGDDKGAKVFEVANFDMINMFRLAFVPLTAAWVRYSFFKMLFF